MAAAAHSGGRVRASADPPPWPNWPAIGVVVAIVVHLVAGVSFAARLDQRVSALELAVPPGSIQTLDERTEQIQKALVRLEARP